MATIQCKCEAVRLEFPVEAELFRHECCCYDCISALWYSTRRGGPEYPHDLCADSCWLPNDFRIETGSDHIGAFMNYASADSVRFYCKQCWSILFADHALYEKKILVSQVAAYKEFEGLSQIVRMEPQARHFLCDRTESEVAALPPWAGDPAHVYEGVAENLLARFPAMMVAAGAGAEMNAQILLAQIGGPFVPNDEPRLAAGPPSIVRQGANRPGLGVED